jgi:hypothetical protein
MYKRALARRNYFKWIESTYNDRFEVEKGYDFLYSAAKSEEVRQFVRFHW